MTEDRYTLKIIRDDDARPWDEFDHLTKIVHWHRQGFIGEDIRGRIDEWRRERISNHDVFLPLYLYEHSGQTVSLQPFFDPWDSGQVGFAWVSAKEMTALYGEGWQGKARQVIEEDVSEFDMWLRGDVWGWVIKDRDGSVVASCWDFYGYDNCEIEGLEALKRIQERQLLLF